MKKTNFDKLPNRWNYYERRADEGYNEEKYDIIGKTHNYGIADINFKAPFSVIEEITKRSKKGTYSYSYIPQLTLNGIQSWYSKQHQLKIETDWLMIVHGTINAMYQMVQAFTKENDYVLLQTPIYNPFAEAIEFNNRVIAENKLIYNEKTKTYEIDFNDFENQIIDKKIKLFMLCSPHNPGSVVWDKETLNKISEICLKHQVVIFSDEVHSDMTFKKFTSFLEYIDTNQIVVANSPNKVFNLGGLKTSYLIVKDKDMQNKLTWQYKKNATTSNNMFANAALQGCFLNQESYEWLNELKDYIWQNYLYFKEEIEKLGFSVADMQATYLPWIQIPKNLSMDFLLQELKKYKIVICTYKDFYHADNTWIRINIATTKKDLEYLIKILNKIVA